MFEKEKITAVRESVNWDEVFAYYGNMRPEIERMNFPDNITDAVSVNKLEEGWEDIRKIIKSVPSYEECKTAMMKAGCKITVGDIEKSRELFDNCVKYSPYMRRRLTLLRIINMIK